MFLTYCLCFMEYSMKKLLLTTILSAGIKLSFGAPTIALPNLVYAPNVPNIGINNIDVRGALIRSGKFKVIEAPRNFNLSAINTSEPDKQSDSESSNKFISNEAHIDDGMKYILIGQVISADTYNNYYKIPNSENSTGSRTLSATISYKLLKLDDRSSVAAFNVNVTGTQTAILKDGETIHPNQSLILHNASKDLGNKVLEELLGQMNDNSSEHHDKPLVTDVTTYD